MQWSEVDWEILQSLRDRFLDENPQSGGDYWRTEAELAHYDLAFAPRIGWKWDAVLADAQARGWQPPRGARILDWGCGTGIATRRLLNVWGPEFFSGAWCWDHSARARTFAVRAIGAAGLPAEERSSGAPPEGSYILLVSHVLNELRELDTLLACARGAAAVLWVEPGTPQASRGLIAAREKLRDRFHLVAPCPHQGQCGLATKQTNDWCHHFAPPPPAIFQSADWEKFSRRLGIDRRSLPTSFLVMSREAVPPAPGPRVLGRPRVYKGYAKLLVCRENAVADETLRKKDAPEIFRDLDAPRFARYLLE